MLNKIKFLLAVVFSLSILTSCNSKKSDDEILTSSVTESTKLKTKITKDSVFTEDGKGKVELVYHIDGDTTYFYDGVNEFSLRYYGINTPESTAKVEPWGNQASEFTKSKLETATDIFLERDAADLKTGDRYLGLVWLKDKDHQDYYCLNLLLVEKAYSENLLFDEDSKYLNEFIEAGNKASKTGLRVYGEDNDPNYDYSDKVYDVTVGEVIDNFESYDLHSNKLLVTGMITCIDKNGIYLADINPTDGVYKSIYFFTFGATFPPKFRVGSIIKVRCKAHYHNGNMQLTEAMLTSLDPVPPVFVEQGTVIFTEINESTDLDKFLNSSVSVNLTIGEKGEPSKNGDITYYCKIKDTNKKLNIRITSLAENQFSEFLVKGNTVKVNAILLKFVPKENPDDFSYQVYVINNRYSNISDYNN